MKRLLIVDDEQEILDIMRQFLEDRFEVTTATTGAAAMERFVRQRPDAVFLDINMPGASGVEVLKLIRETAPDIPVIMITANASVDVAADCLKSGAFGYVPKPFNLAYLDHMVAAATTRSERRA